MTSCVDLIEACETGNYKEADSLTHKGFLLMNLLM